MNSSLVEQAKSGDVEAIATLINQRLEPQGIVTTVAAQGDTLCIELRSPTLIHQTQMLRYLHQAIVQLQIADFEKLVVEARVENPGFDHQDRNNPTWRREVVLVFPPGSQPAGTVTLSSVPQSEQSAQQGIYSHASAQSSVAQIDSPHKQPLEDVGSPDATLTAGKMPNRKAIRARSIRRSLPLAKQQRITIGITVEWFLANGLTGLALVAFFAIVWNLGRLIFGGLLFFFVSPLGQPFIFLVFGLSLGLVQTFVVARRLDNMGWWLLATVLGFSSVLFLAPVIQELPIVLLPFVVFGMVPILQWLVIARQVKQAYAWLIVNGISLLFVQSVVWKIMQPSVQFISLHGGGEIGRVFLLLIAVGLWLATSLMLGLTLGNMLRDRRRRSIHFSRLFERSPFLA
ncbi:MAG: hypothetical protein WBA57_20595 [Elainellaceae cyanobacterium]